MGSLAATTVPALKELLELSLESSREDLSLSRLISEVTTKVEQHLGHDLLQAARTEEYDARHLQEVLWLHEYPVASVASVKHRSDIMTAWADATTLDQGDDWELGDAAFGEIVFGLQPYVGHRTVQVVYTAGYATSQSALETSYPDIVSAIERQIMHEYRLRERLGGESRSFDGSTVKSPPAGLLKAVKESLSAYRRPRFH